VAGTLYVVATPIGNLGDITYRAVKILGEVAVVACEDTRQTRKLLDHYGIAVAAISYHEHNEASRTPELCGRLEAGDSIALVSDAGTPLVSDPGFRLVREAVARGIAVVPVPGPSAMLAALAGSGLPTDDFRFIGFLPPKSQARRRLFESLDAEETVIAFEAPHRIAETLADLSAVDPARPVVIARELTKLHEEFIRGPVSEVASATAARGLRGEITLVIGKRAGTGEGPVDAAALREEVAALERTGISRTGAIKEVAKRHGIGKREVYGAVVDGR
jgi:16S rRNA (cytidine1402-2'-O)-methyltransferase